MIAGVSSKGVGVRRLQGGMVALCLIVAGCSTDDLANDFVKDQGIEINTEGGVPASFPADVPLPDLAIETAVAVAPGFVLRLTSPDAVADVAAYRAKLEAAGFEITDAFDNSGNDAYNVGFTATGNGWVVQPVAFTQDKPVDPGYMGLAVDPAPADDDPSSAPAPVSPEAVLPTGFPADVPLPELPIEVASTFSDGYSVKLTSTDPAGEIAAYRAQLEAAGYVVESEYDHLADSAKNIGFTAVLGDWSVRANALAADGDNGGYMVVSVDPID